MTSSRRSRGAPSWSSDRLGRTLCALAVAVSLAGPFASRAARAQAHQPTAQDLETARTLYKEGKELRAAGNLAAAIEKLAAAHALGNTPVTGIELARTYAMAGKLVEGREVALAVARIPVASDETGKSSDARTEAATLATDLRPRIPTLTVKWSGVGPEETAHLSIDGAPVPDVAVHEPQKVDPGKHDVAVRVGEGAAAREVHGSPEAGEGQAVEVVLEVPPAPAAVPSPVQMPAPVPAPGAEGSGLPPLAKAGFGLAIAGSVVGALAGLGAIDRKAQLSHECNTQQQCDASNNGATDLDAARSWATISTVSFVVAGLGLAGGIVALLTDSRRSPPRAAAGVTPWVGAGMVGVHGRF